MGTSTSFAVCLAERRDEFMLCIGYNGVLAHKSL